jgi:MraZ protein
VLFTGEFRRNLDEKQRVAIPKRIRGAFEQNEIAACFVAPGTDGSLAIYTEESFTQLAERLSRSKPTGQDTRAFSRLFYARAERVEMDSQGRIRIPNELSALAGLSKAVVVIGVRDHLEIWDAPRWDEYLRSQQENYDAIAEGAFPAE